MTYFRVVSILCVMVIFSGLEISHAQERRIQPGDRLQITVIGRSDLTRTVPVRPDGTISFPFLGEENIIGFSLQELRILITARLRRNLDEQVSAIDIVFTVTGQENNVTVLGQVGQPGIFTIDSNAGLQGAITAAGGVLPGALQSAIKVHRVTDEGPTEILVDLDRFYETGDLRYLPPIQEGDIIIVPGGTIATAIRVLGAVENPGNYQPVPGATVFDMILEAGGFTEDARTNKIRLVKPSTGVSEDYALNISEFFQTGKEPESPPVEPGDVIIVHKRIISYRSTLDGLRDIASVLSLFTFFFFLFR